MSCSYDHRPDGRASWQVYPVGVRFGVGLDAATEVALIVGTTELLSVLAGRLSSTGGTWGLLSGFDLDTAGLAIVGAFALTWVVAATVWRLGRIEERWGSAGELYGSSRSIAAEAVLGEARTCGVLLSRAWQRSDVSAQRPA